MNDENKKPETEYSAENLPNIGPDNKNDDRAYKRRKRIITTIAAIAIIAIIILLLLRSCNTEADTALQSVAEKENLSVLDQNGDIEAKDEDIIEKMRKMMDESNVPVNVNAMPYAAKKGDPLNWLIENPSGSNKNLKIEVYLIEEDGTLGEKIYDTKGLLPPSSHISCKDKATGEELSGYAYLDKELEPGTYKAAVLFKGYTTDDTPKYVGTAQAFVDIRIGN